MLDKLNKEYLKLAKISYGGNLYLLLKNYRLKDIFLCDLNIKKVSDIVLSKDGNSEFFSYKNEESGFCANVFENIKNNKIVISFRGTERVDFGENISNFSVWGKDISTDMNLIAGIIDQQFIDAWNLYQCVIKQNKKSKIILTGHSLGGALAQLTAAKAYSKTYRQWWSQRPETYTFNAPGCKHLLKSFDCLENISYSFIKNYAVMNDWCGMFGENVGKTYLIPPIPLNDLTSGSLTGALNNIMLTTHEGIFDYSEEHNGKIIKKPDDFNEAEGLSLWYYDKNNTLKNVDTLQNALENIKSMLPIQSVKDIGRAIKEDTQKFFEEHKPGDVPGLSDFTSPLKEKMKDKFLENGNHEVFKSVTNLMKKTTKNVSIESLKKSLLILRQLKISVNNAYMEEIKNYIEFVENQKNSFH